MTAKLKTKSTLDAALDALLHDIANGGEYPDAEFRAATRHQVDPVELRSAYDEHNQTTSGPERRTPMTQAQLKQRAHQHKITTAEHAQTYQAGKLDVDLLKEAGLAVDENLTHDETVIVEFSHFSHNTNLGKEDPVYRTFAPSGRFIGHYFAAAFSRLEP